MSTASSSSPRGTASPSMQAGTTTWTTINTVPVAPDLTNAARKVASKIKGDRNEDSSSTEGGITFDILFRAIVPATGETIALIINLEPQRTVYTG